MKVKQFVCSLAVFLTLTSSGLAQEGFVEHFGTVRFDTLSSYAIGDGVSYDDLTGPQGNCIDLSESTIHKDIVSGSVSTSARIDVVTSASEVEERLKKSLTLKASANGGLADVFSADMSGSMLDDYSGVVKAENSSLIVLISLYSDRGRDWLDYKLKTEYKKLLTGDSDQKRRFVEICGTHFIRGIKRESAIDIIISVSDLSASSKETLKNEAKAALEGSGTFSSGFKLGGKASVDQKIEKFERRARQLGAVTITIRGQGTSTLGSVAPIIYKSDGSPATISSYIEKASMLVQELSKGEGAPAYFLLTKYAELPEYFFDIHKYIFVEQALTALVEANSILAHYENVSKNSSDFFQDHVLNSDKAVRNIRDVILLRIKMCVGEGACSTSIPFVPKPVTMDRALRGGRLVAICGRNLNGELDGREADVMSDIAIVWRGEIGYPNYMVLDAISAFAITDNGERFDLSDFAARRDFSVEPNVLRSSANPLLKGPGRAIAQLLNRKIDPSEVIVGGEVNHVFLTQYREEIANLTFGLRFRDRTGKVFDQVFGRPDMSQCVIVAK